MTLSAGSVRSPHRTSSPGGVGGGGSGRLTAWGLNTPRYNSPALSSLTTSSVRAAMPPPAVWVTAAAGLLCLASAAPITGFPPVLVKPLVKPILLKKVVGPVVKPILVPVVVVKKKVLVKVPVIKTVIEAPPTVKDVHLLPTVENVKVLDSNFAGKIFEEDFKLKGAH